MCIPHDLRKCKALKPLAAIHFAKRVSKRIVGCFGVHIGRFRASKPTRFCPRTKMKLRACGFEIVCGFVPGFVPNAYARTRGGIRRQGGQTDNQTRPNWNGAATNERERVGIVHIRRLQAPDLRKLVRGFSFGSFWATSGQPLRLHAVIYAGPNQHSRCFASAQHERGNTDTRAWIFGCLMNESV